MLFSDFKNSIVSIQNKALGGIDVQFKLAPAYRKRYNSDILKAKNPTKASVLILFFPTYNGQTAFVLTKRADYDGHHAKQISFPGGKQEISDASLLHTAIRETKEEIGIQIPTTAVFKKLTEVYIPPSNFIVEPHLAFINYTPDFILNYEVKKVITPTLDELLDRNNQKITTVTTQDNRLIETPYFSLQNEVVWGATAMMLSELHELLNCT